MIDLSITTKATDTRVVIPSALVSRLGIPLDEAETLADVISRESASRWDMIRRPLWRQSYREEATGIDTETLPLSRWPIEGNPTMTNRAGTPVEFGSSPELARVTGAHRHSVYRQSGWSRPAGRDALTGDRLSAPSLLEYIIEYQAGYLMPGQVATWLAGATVTSGGSASYGEAYGWARPTSRTSLLRFEGTTGTTGATEPAWPAVAGESVADNDITWTARTAEEMPADLVGVFLLLSSWTLELEQENGRVAKIQETGDEKEKVEWVTDPSIAGQVPLQAARILEAYR